MQYLALAALAGTAAAQSVAKGFNYGNVFLDGTPKTQDTFEEEFSRAQDLPGVSGFSSARLYTMIQAGTANTPISALQAAIDTQTTLLLGLWASAGSEVFDNEVAALESAIEEYGSELRDLIVGISVGSEDLYRESEQGQENDPNPGTSPSTLVGYIDQVRSALEGTSWSDISIGHVDTWNDWVNGTNSDVLDAVDWIGFNAFPYFETDEENSIENGEELFFRAYDAVQDVAGGKEIWVTEAGWPVAGPSSNEAETGPENTQQYWREVGCGRLFDNINTWWYILRDALPNTPSPSFGIMDSDLEEPLFDLTCPSNSGSSSSSSSSSATATGGASASASSSASSGVSSAVSSAAASATDSDEAETAVTTAITSAVSDAEASATATGSVSGTDLIIDPIRTGATGGADAGATDAPYTPVPYPSANGTSAVRPTATQPGSPDASDAPEDGETDEFDGAAGKAYVAYGAGFAAIVAAVAAF